MWNVSKIKKGKAILGLLVNKAILTSPSLPFILKYGTYGKSRRLIIYQAMRKLENVSHDILAQNTLNKLRTWPKLAGR